MEEISGDVRGYLRDNYRVRDDPYTGRANGVSITAH
jgi:hypothetical protein